MDFFYMLALRLYSASGSSLHLYFSCTLSIFSIFDTLADVDEYNQNKFKTHGREM
jgi:hypothetical protein